MVVANFCLLFRCVGGQRLGTRKNGCNKETARSLLASHGTSPHQGQKPAKPLSTTRYDGKDHWIVPISTERRCANQC